ncbi:MAG: hypothetical protein ACKOXR_06795 [Bacteroidota bacterium]
MKKATLWIITILTFHQSGIAQRFYVNISAGKNIPLSKTSAGLFSVSDLSMDSIGAYTYVGQSVSFYKGKSADATLGYKITNQVGLEVNYSTNSSVSFYKNWLTNSYKQSSDISVNNWKINPSIVLFVPFKKIELYSKIGVSFGKGILTNHSRFTEFGGDDYDYTREISLKQSLGTNAAIGCNYPVYKNFSINGEILTSTSSLITQKGTLTKYYLNGVDVLSTLSVRTKEMNFMDQYYYDPNVVIDENSPYEINRDHYSLSGVTFKLGVKYSF